MRQFSLNDTEEDFFIPFHWSNNYKTSKDFQAVKVEDPASYDHLL